MFSSVSIRLFKPAASGAAGLRFRLATQTRLVSQKASSGSKGRTMPLRPSRATAPVTDVDATFTIRVCFPLSILPLGPPI